MRCSPTRMALAIAVSAGFTAPMLGKKLVSTTYRLSSSWALQSVSRTEVAGIGAEPAGAGLVGDAGDGDVHVHVEVLVEHVVLGEADVVEQLLQLVVQPVGLVVVGRRVGEVDVAVAVDGDPVVRLGEVLGGEPEVEGVAGDLGQREVRGQLGELGFLALHRFGVGLADHLDVAGRPVVVGRPEVEVVEPDRLLEDGVVGFLGQGDDRLAVVEHVVAADLVGAVGEAVGVLVVRRAQQQLGRVRRARRHDDDVAGVDLGVAAAGRRRRR